MAEVTISIFNEEMYCDRAVAKQFVWAVMHAVGYVHYGTIKLEPGDITVRTLPLDLELSTSKADYELNITEGSDNWPRRRAEPVVGESALQDGDVLLDHDSAAKVLDNRARRISVMMMNLSALARRPHNIFEQTGIATGWLMADEGLLLPYSAQELDSVQAAADLADSVARSIQE